MKQKDLINYLRSLEGQRIDHDGYYGSQCVDLPMHIFSKFFNFRPWGNAIDYLTNAMPIGAKREVANGKNLDLIPGDLIVYQNGSSDKYGHVGFLLSKNGNTITCLEQNVDGNWDYLTVGGPARIKTRVINGYLVGRIRLPLEIDEETNNYDWTRRKEIGTFTLTVDALNVRNMPNTKNNIPVAQYEKGDLINYDSYTVANGYVWISYISNSGIRRYVAVREIDDNGRFVETFGTFK